MPFIRRVSQLFMFGLLIILMRCAPIPTQRPLPDVSASQQTSTPAPLFTSTAGSTPTSAPSSTPTDAPSLTPTLTPPPALEICSPLAGIERAALPALVSNPYHPPAPGSDNPHQGVDLAIIDPANQIALQGSTVQSIMAGQVALLITDRFPYGNAVLIETTLDAASADSWSQAGLPTAAPTVAANSALTCPLFSQAPILDPQSRSVYVLYAHLQASQPLQVGQPIGCGEAIGAVGMSGNALNPHLHVEMRVGPANLRLSSMAHYDASASQDEMAGYCLWRVSGVFQRIDPLEFMK